MLLINIKDNYIWLDEIKYIFWFIENWFMCYFGNLKIIDNKIKKKGSVTAVSEEGLQAYNYKAFF